MAPRTKMRVLVCPDLHGRHEAAYNAHRKFIVDGVYDRLIFLGDYVDSYDRTDEDMYSTLKAVLSMKSECPDDIILLLGNHDAQYMYGPNGYKCSGFRESTFPNLKFLFNEHRNNFQLAYQIKDFLFTHAGVQLKWWKKHANKLEHYAKLIDEDISDVEAIGKILNAANESGDRSFLYEVGAVRGGWYGNHGGSVWCDRSEILLNVMPSLHQIVGHTPTPYIYKETVFNGSSFNNTSVTFTDVLNKKEQFYEVIITL